MKTTVLDCNLDGALIALPTWPLLSSDELARIVGKQGPGDIEEDARDYEWRFEMVPLERLRFSSEDGEEPEGGWVAAHKRHLKADAEAVAGGSPEYAGRDDWLKKVWAIDTAIYPLYVVEEEDGRLRLWDGYRRLAGAFAHKVQLVATLIGRRRTK